MDKRTTLKHCSWQQQWNAHRSANWFPFDPWQSGQLDKQRIFFSQSSVTPTLAERKMTTAVAVFRCCRHFPYYHHNDVIHVIHTRRRSVGLSSDGHYHMIPTVVCPSIHQRLSPFPPSSVALGSPWRKHFYIPLTAAGATDKEVVSVDGPI